MTQNALLTRLTRLGAYAIFFKLYGSRKSAYRSGREKLNNAVSGNSGHNAGP